VDTQQGVLASSSRENKENMKIKHRIKHGIKHIYSTGWLSYGSPLYTEDTNLFATVGFWFSTHPSVRNLRATMDGNLRQSLERMPFLR
jgi:hypothetical protein